MQTLFSTDFHILHNLSIDIFSFQHFFRRNENPVAKEEDVCKSNLMKTVNIAENADNAFHSYYDEGHVFLPFFKEKSSKTLSFGNTPVYHPVFGGSNTRR